MSYQNQLARDLKKERERENLKQTILKQPTGNQRIKKMAHFSSKTMKARG